MNILREFNSLLPRIYYLKNGETQKIKGVCMKKDDGGKTKKATSIAVRLFRAIAITIVSIVGFICAVIGVQLYKKNIVQFDEFTSQQFFNIEKSVSLFIQNGKSVVKMLAENPAVKNADETLYNCTIEAQKSGVIYTHNGKAEQDIKALFVRMEKNYEAFKEIYMGTRWGGFVTSWSEEDEQGFDPRTRPWYKNAAEANGEVIITPVYISTDGSPVVALARAIKDPKGTFLGCIGIDIDLAGLTSFISGSKIGSTGYCMLVQNDGMILADPKHPQYNFKIMSEMDIPAFAEIEKTKEGSLLVNANGEMWKAFVFPFFRHRLETYYFGKAKRNSFPFFRAFEKHDCYRSFDVPYLFYFSRFCHTCLKKIF